MTEQPSVSRTEVTPARARGASPVPEPPADPTRPAQAISAPPAYLVLLIDASGSMADDGKSAALDHAVTALVERLAASRTCSWHVAAVVFGPDDRAFVHRDMRPVASWLRWPRLQAGGGTPVGAALAVAADLVGDVDSEATSVVLFTDGFPTDDWRAGLNRLARQAPRARRFSVGIGQDADIAVLKAIASEPREHHVLRTDEVIDLPGLVESLAGWMPQSPGPSAYVACMTLEEQAA